MGKPPSDCVVGRQTSNLHPTNRAELRAEVDSELLQVSTLDASRPAIGSAVGALLEKVLDGSVH